MGLRYPKGLGFELTVFSNADHAGCIDTRKSTSGGIQFLGDKLVSWMSKKQDCTAMSSAEADTPVPSTSILGIISSKNKLKMSLGLIGDECVMGKMPTKTELTLEQSQQGVNNDVLIHKDGDGDASFQLKSNSSPHAHAQSTKTFYKHQESKNQESSSIKDKDFRKL
ncbi:retrovirus-related pol polyprotein from transposon TNT 1-94 [Tanacetum coccineum]